MKLTIDLNKLTLRDVEDFEEKSGIAIGDVGNGKALPARAVRAMLWVTQRKVEPGFTYEDAGDVAVGELDLGGGNPKDEAGEVVDSSPSSRPSVVSMGSRPRSSGGSR